jgi:ubiquinone/menaquinone biosynthesis C-methylase UbiE
MKKQEKDPKHHHRGKSSERHVDKDQILVNLEILPGQTILDAGCGNGYMAKEFARLTENTGKVYALDPDHVAINTLKTETENTVIEPFVSDITCQTNLETSSIDLIYLSTVLHGFSQDQVKGFRKEVLRLLRPNGRLAIVEFKKETTPFGPPLDIRYSPEELIWAINMKPVKLIDVGSFFYMQIFKKSA